MKYLPLAGRLIISLHFLMAAPFHFSHDEISQASSQGVPLAGVMLPFSGVMALAGALSLILS